MASKIQLRRDTAANWTLVNPTLSQGELGYETDTDKVKVGDGITAWASLGYLIDGVTSASIPTLLDQLSDVVLTSPVNGDLLAYNNGQWVNVVPINTGGGVALTDLSVIEQNTPAGGGSLTYDNTTGVFTYTPADFTSIDLTGYVSKADLSASLSTVTTLEELISALQGLGA